MKVADYLFHALIREQNLFVDLSYKGEDSSNQGTVLGQSALSRLLGLASLRKKRRSNMDF
jgi:hypothetical protein